MPLTVETFTEIAAETEGILLAADVEDELPERIRQVISRMEGPEMDLVLVIDTTQSMVNSIRVVQQDLVPSLLADMERFERYRIGVVFFRDYFEEYLARPYPFQEKLEDVQRIVNLARAAGGRDIPEAVYEGLYTGLVRYDWEAPERQIILIGDAPPHPRPRGAVTREMVFEKARELGVRINAIMLPHP
ncbi:MAG: VWA domain-containing protein [Spirochaetaceae bacterium]|nr:MAG: VWA domain-containing protein [Spirochaetaceae bacterium]